MNRSPGEPSESRALPPTAGRSLWRRSWLRVVGILLVAYLLVLGLMMAMEDSLIYFPSVYPDGMWNPPGLDFEDAWFEAADGTKLHGWYVPVANPRAVILFAHGNAGNLSHRVDFLEMLNRLRVTVLIFDYRGYGRSTGSPSETGVLQDARAARRWLAERADIDESKIVLLGESLGGGVMVDLAAADGARALVLQNTFTSLTDVARFHYPWLPINMLMRTRFDSLSKIGRYHGPLLQFHGDADTIIPFALAQRLYAAANEPKQLTIIPGGDHNDPPSRQFQEALDRFLDRLPAER
jgi:uncharacterized protein